MKKEVCPRCGREAVVKNIWVKNASKKIYYYKIYIHENGKHYVNTSIENQKLEKSKKAELYSVVLNKVSTIDYFKRKFCARELFDDLKLTYKDVDYSNLRRILVKLSQNEIITKIYDGKKIFFSLSPKVIGRLYRMSIMKIVLDQNRANNSYTREFDIIFKNITIFPLRFYFLVIHFDKPTEPSRVRLSASDMISNIPLKILYSVIDETAMFIYINFDQPLYPGQEKKIKFIYEAEGFPNDFYFAAKYDIELLTVCIHMENIRNVNFYVHPKGETKPFPVENSLIRIVKDNNEVAYCFNYKYSPDTLIQIKWF